MSENTTNKPTEKKRAPQTYKCAVCERRRPIEDQMESSLGNGGICQDCWDDE